MVPNSFRIWFIHKTFKKYINENQNKRTTLSFDHTVKFLCFYYAFHRNSFNWQNIKQIDLRFRCPYQSEVCMHEMYNQTNCMYRKKLSTKVYVLCVWMTLICLLVFWPIHRKNPTNILPEFDKPHIQKHDSYPSSPHMNDY